MKTGNIRASPICPERRQAQTPLQNVKLEDPQDREPGGLEGGCDSRSIAASVGATLTCEKTQEIAGFFQQVGIIEG